MGCADQVELADIIVEKITMSEFTHSTAKIAAWNHAGFNPISDEKFEKQGRRFAQCGSWVGFVFSHTQRSK